MTLNVLFALHHSFQCLLPPCYCLYHNISILERVLLHHLNHIICHGIIANNVVPPYIHISLPLATLRVHESQFLLDSLDHFFIFLFSKILISARSNTLNHSQNSLRQQIKTSLSIFNPNYYEGALSPVKDFYRR